MISILGAVAGSLLYLLLSFQQHAGRLLLTNDDMILLACVAWISGYLAWSIMTLLIARQQQVSR
ncbi:MAG TPA: hypothetical protein VHL31_23435 [Geminicoccus sp.]|jgi:hypothetical protein|uniref:hypothetical protein n=1 Tax=Geminicoccus sp. TaxID=2024832 RepID=UPI002E3819D2|nr:hypothetical protein [Geminicoccus sp.]HEX2529238.1 hypothetical protein [Geminicoccus sp.]